MDKNSLEDFTNNRISLIEMDINYCLKASISFSQKSIEPNVEK